MFYSPSKQGFYTPEVHGTNIPTDAVEITEDEWRALLEGQANGKIITVDANGAVTLTDPPPQPAPEPVPITEKLATLGIDVNELKTLLGVA